MLGENAAALTPSHPECVLNNVMVYDSDDFAKEGYNALARDITPSDSGLLWHDVLSEGGDVLSFTNESSAELNAYLIPTAPTAFSADEAVDPTDIRFGGRGVIEIPFYLDFDEYFWTTTNAAARLEWCFQLKVTLPKILSVGTVFELQDLAHLTIINDGGTYKFECSFNDGDSLVTNSVGLTGGNSYDVFVGRDETNVAVKVASTEVTAAASDPIIYDYDKTIGFVVGDRVDFENSDPFGGRVERFALHNSSARSFHEIEDAVLYYDVDSIQGDEVLDRGNRALNAYLGVRSDTQSPFYSTGGFPGGSYVAAVGGFLISNSRPDINYTGQLRKPLTKDAVVQRRGQRSFLTSNGVSYIVDDRSKTFRPLGLPRPSTKVSCTPQGVGPIDGFVRYAYRYVSTDGTVGPVFELDPCDATGGVNVFLGAEAFNTPSDPAFGLSYGECDADKDVADDEVQCFIAHDNDGSNNQLLHKEIINPGLTSEIAFRFPNAFTSAKESVISQGVCVPKGASRWMAGNFPKTFPWICKQSQECCIQFTFRFQTPEDGDEEQCLFTIGNKLQKYKTGWNNETQWRLHALVASIQKPEDTDNDYSIVITRNSTGGSKNNDLTNFSADVDLVDANDYSLFVTRGGSNEGDHPGANLSIMLYNHTAGSWENWPDDSGANEIVKKNFWGTNYSADLHTSIMWGACRFQDKYTEGKTRVRDSAGSATFALGNLKGFHNYTNNAGANGQRMYHARMWRCAPPKTLLHAKALERYGARTGQLSKNLEVDVAFSPDSSKERINGGYDYVNDLRVKFHAGNKEEVEALVTTTGAAENSVIYAYGFDNTIGAGTPDTHATTSLDTVPLWCAYNNRDEGSLVIGTGRKPAVSIANKKWHAGSEVQLFSDFANTIDLSQWTWITLYFSQLENPGTSDRFDVWLERVFIDGNTGDWGDLFQSDTATSGPGGKNQNTDAGNGQYTLFTCGGIPGMDNDYELEIAETRLWDGEYYTALGGGTGANAFGPYLSTRIPPNKWSELWHYTRFVPSDVHATNPTMDQVGRFNEVGGSPQQTVDAVGLYQSAEVKEGGDTGGSGGSSYFVPFPSPPLSAIRGIQIFRTQIVPVEEDYPNGEPNPNAQTDGFKACRAAPLYYLSEIPDGTQAYFDSAVDALLGAELNLTEGLIPGNPGGVFEWGNYLAIWVTDIPRIHFAASPDSWESYPTDMILDLPLNEYGTIEAATELASRDARQSRVLVLGKSWGLFLDGSPVSPQVNSLGGGVGAASSRCLVVEKGIAYAYNGTLWAISGSGEVEDIGMPVLDLLPSPANARLSVSSALGSLFVIDESTGLALRWHFARREWFVEDRYALSTTDIAGVDYWVHLTGYPSKGDTTVYGDDLNASTSATYTVSSMNNGADTVTVSSATGLKLGQRLTVVATEDPRIRQTVTIASMSGAVLTVTEDLDLPATSSNNLAGSTVTLTYKAYVGVGYWGTMLDTGQFLNSGVLHHVEMGLTSGERWYAMSEGADFARDPSDRSGFDAPESHPTHLVDADGAGASSRWGLTSRQRVQRLLVWSLEQGAVGLSECELAYSDDA